MATDRQSDVPLVSSTSNLSPAACVPSNDYLSRLPPLASEHIISAAHIVAAAGFSFSAVAASSPQGAKLPFYGAALFIAVLSLRIILLARQLRSWNLPKLVSGPEMSLLAASVFVSNALASVATLANPDDMLIFVAFSALDVTANWLHMVAYARTPSVQKFPILKFLIFTAGDGFVGASVAGATHLSTFLWPLFLSKGLLNVIMAWLASKTVLSRDAAARLDLDSRKND